MLVLLVAAGLAAAERPMERDICRRLADSYHAQVEYVLPDQSRVDLYRAAGVASLRDEIWEVDWAENWAEAVGQALYYAAFLEADGRVVLLSSDPVKDKVHILRAKIACNRAGLALEVYRVKAKEGE